MQTNKRLKCSNCRVVFGSFINRLLKLCLHITVLVWAICSKGNTCSCLLITILECHELLTNGINCFQYKLKDTSFAKCCPRCRFDGWTLIQSNPCIRTPASRGFTSTKMSSETLIGSFWRSDQRPPVNRGHFCYSPWLTLVDMYLNRQHYAPLIVSCSLLMVLYNRALQQKGKRSKTLASTICK